MNVFSLEKLAGRCGGGCLSPTAARHLVNAGWRHEQETEAEGGKCAWFRKRGTTAYAARGRYRTIVVDSSKGEWWIYRSGAWYRFYDPYVYPYPVPGQRVPAKMRQESAISRMFPPGEGRDWAMNIWTGTHPEQRPRLVAKLWARGRVTGYPPDCPPPVPLPRLHWI